MRGEIFLLPCLQGHSDIPRRPLRRRNALGAVTISKSNLDIGQRIERLRNYTKGALTPIGREANYQGEKRPIPSATRITKNPKRIPSLIIVMTGGDTTLKNNVIAQRRGAAMMKGAATMRCALLLPRAKGLSAKRSPLTTKILTESLTKMVKFDNMLNFDTEHETLKSTSTSFMLRASVVDQWSLQIPL